MWFVIVVTSLILFFAFSNGFHDAATWYQRLLLTRLFSPRKSPSNGGFCEFIAPFFLGAAVAKMTRGKYYKPSRYDPKTFNIFFSLPNCSLSSEPSCGT